MTIKVAKFLDVSAGTQPNQFTVGERSTIESLDELDPTFKKLMDDPVTQVLGIVGPGGRANLTPMWFDYGDDMVWSTAQRTAPRPTGSATTRGSRACSSTRRTRTTG